MNSRTTKICKSATLALFSVLFAANRTDAQNLLYEVPNLGYSVARVGDLDLDGVPDVAVASLMTGVGGCSFCGVVKVLSGASGNAVLTLSGQSYASLVGVAICGTGDLNGDGYPDVGVGTPFADTNGSDSGALQVFSGKLGSVLFAVSGDDVGDRLGASLANVGDIDQDGKPDIATGAIHDDSTHGVDCGAVWVVSGGTHAVIFKGYGDAKYDLLGTSVAGVGDIDGDGLPDVAAGTYRFLDPQHPGYVRIFSPATGASLMQIYGNAPLDGFGSALACAGDLDLDGVPDLLVGASLTDSARVHSGKDGHLLAGLSDVPGSQFGFAVASGEDLSGDGIPDLVVGAPNEDIHGGVVAAGTATLFSGASFAKLYQVEGAHALDHFGISVAIPGDIDSQGASDFAVGMHSTSDQSLPEYVRVYKGACGTSANVGAGCKGSLNFVPTLDITGCFATGGHVLLKIDNCIGNAPVVMLFGAGAANAVLPNGCHLYLSQLLPVTLPLKTNNGSVGGASVTVNATLPPLAGGFTIRAQAFIQDPGAPGGHSGTGAVEMKFD